MTAADHGLDADPDAYLARLGLDRDAGQPADRDAGQPADRDALATLQRAHVLTVPFETLAITGDPVAITGDPAPVAVVYVGLVVAWDVCDRIGTSWWACVVAAWRSYRYEFDEGTAATPRRVDRPNAGVALVQLALAPLVVDHCWSRCSVTSRRSCWCRDSR
jgi:hypothetical protein